MDGVGRSDTVEHTRRSVPEPVTWEYGLRYDDDGNRRGSGGAITRIELSCSSPLLACDYSGVGFV